MIPPLDLGSFAFAAPLALLGLAALPVVLWLLRLTPPSPRRQTFPPLRLLQGLQERAQHAARTPPWLLALRMAALALAMIGLAQPILAPPQAAFQKAPLLVVIDDGWSAATDWDNRRTAALALLDRAITSQRPAALMTTAPPADGSPLTVPPFRAASDARRALQALSPKPWGSDYAAVQAILAQARQEDAIPKPTDVVWFADGIAPPPASPKVARALATDLQRLGSLTVIPATWPQRQDGPPALSMPLLLLPPQRQGDSLDVLVRWPQYQAEPSAERRPLALTLRASDDQGRTLAVAALEQETSAQARGRLTFPPESLAQVARLDLVAPDGRPTGAGGVQILGDQWRQRPVGLVRWDAAESGIPLLSAETYLRTALTPAHDLRTGSLSDLLAQPIGSLLLPDSPQAAALAGPEAEALEHWVRKGGVLIRFAGPALAAHPSRPQAPSPLLPVRLRQGGRTLGGVLSWTEPAHLAPFDRQSPFAGLTVPPGVDVSSQVLADPLSVGEAQIWARLDDGTPLVSAARREAGWLVLVHTTADPSWSTLPLSGLYPALLDRLVSLAGGGDGLSSSDRLGDQASLPPLRTLDGLGGWQAPPVTAQPLPLDQPQQVVSASHPPGLYGPLDRGQGARQALNLGQATSTLSAVTGWPEGVSVAITALQGGAIDLGPWLLLAALGLLWLDALLSLWLRGLLGARQRPLRRSRTLGLLIAALVGVSLARPAESAEAPASEVSAAEAQRLLDGHLGYVLTGDAAVDAISRAGLTELTAVLHNRTSIELGPPQGISLSRDDLTFLPLLYWPAVAAPLPLDAATRAQLDLFRAHGGVILFDAAARPDGSPATDALRQTLQAAGITRLLPIPRDHLLTRTFYLTPGLPGRLPEGQVWIEPAAIPASADQASEQAVSSVIAGTTDWAGAWAVNSRGRAMLPLLGGGDRGREMAYRAGVNMVVYALTGTYKSDQVHVPAILERLDGPPLDGPIDLLAPPPPAPVGGPQ